MTTICYKNGIVAYDSRATRGDTLISDCADKKHRRGSLTFFMVGATCDHEEFIATYPDKLAHDNNEASGFVCDGKNIKRAFLEKGRHYQCKIEGNHDAMGSGSHFALAAMDCGKSAHEAVAVAAGRDLHTGGKIRVYKIR